MTENSTNEDAGTRYRGSTEKSGANGLDVSELQNNEVGENIKTNDDGDGVAMKKEINLFSGICVVMGCIIGSGIFISPKGVLEYSGSVGTALIVWSICGVVAFLGGLCYAELGSSIPKSGGEYTYLNEAFGPTLAFLMLWVNFVIVAPGDIAIISQTFAIYAVVPFYGECDPPRWAVVLISEACILLVYGYNCVTVRGATWVQNVCTVAKVIGLGIIIIAGIVLLFQGNTEYLNFDGPGTDPIRISLAFYNGLFSFVGWSCLNALTEELKNPVRDFPIAAVVSMSLVTVVYVLTNIAYFAAMSPQELLSSPAVAVTFGDKVLGNFAWLMPLAVALSTFGATNGNVLSLSRLVFVGARDGLLPDLLGMVHIRFLTPMPALIAMMIFSIIYGLYDDVGSLINYTGFAYWLFVGIVVTGLLWLRYKRPELKRPFKVPLVIPIIFSLFCYLLVFVSIFASPLEAAIGLAIILTGIPFYLYGVVWKNKPTRLRNILDSSCKFFQKIMLVVRQEVTTFDTY
ncbi:Y+L amino acid transporter 2-like [Glandiceps talaboti]